MVGAHIGFVPLNYAASKTAFLHSLDALPCYYLTLLSWRKNPKTRLTAYYEVPENKGRIKIIGGVKTFTDLVGKLSQSVIEYKTLAQEGIILNISGATPQQASAAYTVASLAGIDRLATYNPRAKDVEAIPVLQQRFKFLPEEKTLLRRIFDGQPTLPSDTKSITATYGLVARKLEGLGLVRDVTVSIGDRKTFELTETGRFVVPFADRF